MVNQGEIEKRLDADFYLPSLLTLEKKVKTVTSKRLKDFIVSMGSGATPLKENAEYYTEDKEQGIPFLRVQNLCTDSSIELEDCKYITQEVHQTMLKRSQVTDQDLLLKITGVGRMAIASVPPKGFIGNTNQHIAVLRTGCRDISLRLAYFLNTDIAEKLAARRATGGTRPALDYDALKSLPIIEAPEIVALMETAYATKRQKEAEAQALLASIDTYVLEKLGITLPTLEKRQCFGVMSSTVEGSRLDGEYYGRILKDNITATYPLFSLNTLIQDKIIVATKGKTLTKETTTEGLIPVVAGGQSYAYYHSEANVTVEALTISASGAYSGYVWFHDYPFWASDCSVLYTNYPEKLTTFFLYAYLHSRQVEIYKRQRGAGQPHVSISDILDIQIPLPPKAVQDEIATEVQHRMATAKRLKAEAKQAIETAKHQVEALLFGA